MEAYVSGMRGLAVLDDGGRFFALEPGQGKARPISHQGAMILLDECRDLEKLLTHQVREVEERLSEAIAEQRTLQAALFLLDGQLPIELRQKIAQSLDLYLAEEHLKVFLESTLFAKPLPDDGDLAGAKAAAEGVRARIVAAFLNELKELQPTIAEVAAAWDGVPAELLENEAQAWLPVLVRQGTFRRIVLLSHAGQNLQIVLAEAIPNPHFRRLKGSAAVLKSWVQRLGHTSPSRSYQESSVVAEKRGSLLETDFLARHRFPGIVGSDPGFLRVLEVVTKISSSDFPVLVQGPSGSGKELIVRALHLNSPRAKNPLVTINCGAISSSMVQSELFGQLRGSFTGATRDRTGVIASAEGGSVFLDEIGELPLELQVKLLRTIQFGEVQPVGADSPITVNVRFLAATNRDLEEVVRQGKFRKDLLYRLNVIKLDLPPLTERPGDILPLFYHFLQTTCASMGRAEPEVSPRLEWVLLEYDWPGNIRELENEAKRMVAVSTPGLPLTVDQLSPRLTRVSPVGRAVGNLSDQERELIEFHLRLSGGNRAQTAQRLGISRESLSKKLKRLGLD